MTHRPRRCRRRPNHDAHDDPRPDRDECSDPNRHDASGECRSPMSSSRRTTSPPSPTSTARAGSARARATEAFEQAFAAYAGARHALAVANGTAALHLICAGGRARAGRRGHRAVADLRRHGQRDRLHRRDAGLRRHRRPDRAVAGSRRRRGRAITPRTRAIMSMAYGGHPGETRGAARARRASAASLLLEDAAHAPDHALARAPPRHVRLARAPTASSRTRISRSARAAWSSATTTSVAARLRLLRSHGMTTLSWDRHRGHAAGYDVVALGFNYRIDEPRARSGSRRLARLDAENAARAELDARYRELLRGVPGVDAALAPGRGRDARPPPLHGRARRGRRPRRVPRARSPTHGMQTSVHYPPAHRFEIYAEARGRPARHRRLRRARGHAADVRAHDGGAGRARRRPALAGAVA